MQESSPQRVALVTGSGSRRIGNVIATTLAERGYAIGLHYQRSVEHAESTAARLRAEGVEVLLLQADVSREEEVERMFQRLREQFGRLDVLVTAAAIWKPKPLETTTAEDVRREFEINTLGTFLCCQKAGMMMVQQPQGGAIVTMGDWAFVRPYADYAAYFPSKGAIPTLTRTLAVELALRNPAVRVNCILPGPVLLSPSLPEAERQRAIAGTLVRREGTPEQIAHAVVFLVENEFVTGVCLPVDGGRTIAGGQTERAWPEPSQAVG